jgi:hypothetical protein
LVVQVLVAQVLAVQVLAVQVSLFVMIAEPAARAMAIWQEWAGQSCKLQLRPRLRRAKNNLTNLFLT